MAVVSRPLKPRRASNPARLHQLTPLITAVLYGLALLIIALLLQQALVWGQRRIDDLRYGFPRAVHLNAVLAPADAQGTPTHIIALNLNGQVSVLLIPSGDVSQIKTLVGPYLVGRDGPYEVPLLTLQDVNADTWPDLLVTLRGEMIVYINDQGVLRIITAEERAVLNGGGP